MKLGKKLDVTDVTVRLKLLIDGAEFYTNKGIKLWFDRDTYKFMCGKVFMHNDKSLVLDDWYYPPKEYTINGVTLTDERVDCGA